MDDLPTLFASIREKPADESRWLALSRWLGDKGRDDEAVAVRVYWSAMRDTMTTGVSLDAILADLARNARLLGEMARMIEERRLQEPE
jgi:hypothetical protein